MGTEAWTTWRAFEAGADEIENFDDELHSDVQFTGGPSPFGPFELATVIRSETSVGPAVLLHGGIHANLIPQVVIQGNLAPADSSAYHGGTIGDEIAALVALELGVRLRLAGTARLSGIHEGSQSRSPIHFEVPRLGRPGRAGRENLPQVVRRDPSLDALTRIATFPSLQESDQIELIRAARSYASAIWWANEDPNLAWLQLVTAAETAANHRQSLLSSPLELVQELRPELWHALEPASADVQNAVAEILAPQLRSTMKFIDFVTEYTPEPPEPRPQDGSLAWDLMRRHSRVIYGHRSKALHAAKPFPLPMLGAPRVDEDGGIQEVPWGLNSGGMGGVWDAAEAPMLLSTFEHIVRGALLRWWDDLACS